MMQWGSDKIKSLPLLSDGISEWIEDVRKDEDLIDFADKCELYFDNKIDAIQELDNEILTFNDAMDSNIKRKYLSFKVSFFIFAYMIGLTLIAIKDLFYGIKLILRDYFQLLLKTTFIYFN